MFICPCNNASAMLFCSREFVPPLQLYMNHPSPNPPTTIHSSPRLSLDLRPQRHKLILSLPLPQNHLRRSPLNLPIHILRSFRMTTSMIDPLPNLHRVHPDKLLRFVQPLHLEFLLADRAHAVSERGVVGDGEVLQFGGGACEGGGGGFRYDFARVVFDFPGADPVLTLLVVKWGMGRAGGLPVRQRTNFGAGLVTRLLPCVAGRGNASPCVRLSSSYFLRRT